MGAILLVWPGAIAIGLSLGLLGSGGSILTVPVLVYLVGQEEKVAIAGSLAIVGLIALAGVLPYLRRGLVDWRSVVLFGLPGMLGTYGGAWASVFVSGLVQLVAFAGVMLLAAWFMLKPAVAAPVPVPGGSRSPYKIMLEGLVVGIVTGFVGVGGGFLVVPALVLLGGLPMQRAVPTSLAIIALKSFTGFVKYLDVIETRNLEIDVQVILSVAAIGIIGSYLGSAVAMRMPQHTLKRVFGVFLVGMGMFILYRSVPTIIGA
ncbi:MAG: sulfite exporter TauE/SafE family protein [Pseudomonadales bacterium]|nr:sulfite exporter TauE/SafE family protein [Pseudomonadales bacterium]